MMNSKIMFQLLFVVVTILKTETGYTEKKSNNNLEYYTRLFKNDTKMAIQYFLGMEEKEKKQTASMKRKYRKQLNEKDVEHRKQLNEIENEKAELGQKLKLFNFHSEVSFSAMFKEILTMFVNTFVDKYIIILAAKEQISYKDAKKSIDIIRQAYESFLNNSSDRYAVYTRKYLKEHNITNEMFIDCSSRNYGKLSKKIHTSVRGYFAAKDLKMDFLLLKKEFQLKKLADPSCIYAALEILDEYFCR